MKPANTEDTSQVSEEISTDQINKKAVGSEEVRLD